MTLLVPILAPAQRVSDFTRMTEDRYIAGRSWMCFSVQSLTGIVWWGIPEASDVAQLLEVMPSDVPSLRRPRYFDARRLEGAKDEALVAFSRFIAGARQLTQPAERVAVVHGSRLSEVVVTGITKLVEVPYDVGSFANPVEALTWLGHRAPARLAAELDDLHASAVGATPLLRDVRAAIATDLPGADLAKVATALGHSVRSLQRKLRDEATSFQRELNACRVAAAKKLLVDTDQPIDAIARDVGATARHFGDVFRAHTGVTPRQWRKANGKAA
jgi:AraC-like DNA-binding protein